MKNIIKLKIILNWLVNNAAITRRKKVITFIGQPSLKNQKLVLTDETNKMKIKEDVNSTSLIKFILDHTEQNETWKYLDEIKSNPFAQQIVRQIVLVVTQPQVYINKNEIVIKITDTLINEIADIISYQLVDSVKLAILPKNYNSVNFRQNLANMMLSTASENGSIKLLDSFKAALVGFRSKIKLRSDKSAFVTIDSKSKSVTVGTYTGESPIRTYNIDPESFREILEIIGRSRKHVVIDRDWLKESDADLNNNIYE